MWLDLGIESWLAGSCAVDEADGAVSVKTGVSSLKVIRLSPFHQSEPVTEKLSKRPVAFPDSSTIVRFDQV